MQVWSNSRTTIRKGKSKKLGQKLAPWPLWPPPTSNTVTQS